MKRIQAACLCQTLQFSLKDQSSRKISNQQLELEISNYKKQLTKMHIPYRIIKEEKQPDGSIIIQIIKPYNYNPMGEYLHNFPLKK
ncbi:MAG: hypothetical protein IJW96_02785 [Clostridia bacterium]|nr:hypothetical protein [Clostridia bacterium]